MMIDNYLPSWDFAEEFSLLVSDHPGVLQRVCALLTRRGINIRSITVGPSEQQGCSRMTLVTESRDKEPGQIAHQLNKLIDVIRVDAWGRGDCLPRELALARIPVTEKNRSQAERIVQTYGGETLAAESGMLTVQSIAEAERLDEGI